MKFQQESVFSVHVGSLWLLPSVILRFEMVGIRIEIDYFLGFGYILLLKPSVLLLLFPSDNLSVYVDWL